MSQHQEAYAPDHISDARKSSSSGCFFWGCLIVVVLFIIAAVAFGFGGYWLFSAYSAQLEKYTSEAPAEMPTVELSEEEMQELHQRIESFRAAVREDQASGPAEAAGEAPGDDAAETPEPPSELVLTAEEINALIAENEDLRGKAHVEIEEGTVRGDVSIPTDMLPRGNGRYFNASGVFEVSMEDGILVVRLTEATVKGEPVPEPVLESFRQQNLARDLYQDPENAKLLRKFESVQVEDERIVLKLKPDVAEDAGEDAAGESAEPAAAAAGEASPDPNAPASEPEEAAAGSDAP